MLIGALSSRALHRESCKGSNLQSQHETATTVSTKLQVSSNSEFATLSIPPFAYFTLELFCLPFEYFTLETQHKVLLGKMTGHLDFILAGSDAALSLPGPPL